MATLDPENSPTVEIPVLRLNETELAKLIKSRRSFLKQEQHDHQAISWDGGQRDPGVGYLVERLKPQGYLGGHSIPSAKRRPSCPYPIGRQIITRFTDLIYGNGTPATSVLLDVDTTDYLAEAMEESDAWDVFIEARMETGAVGGAAILVSIVGGEPCCELLKADTLDIQEWDAEKRGWVPKRVIQQYLIEKSEFVDGKRQTAKFWRTRYWDDQYSIEFEDVPEDFGSDDREGEVQFIPVDAVFEHKLGRCPIVWIQNVRCTDSPFSETDLEAVYDMADELDRMQSFVTRGTKANVDPTLVIKDNERMLRKQKVTRKGHGARIDVSDQGDAKLLEMSGTSIQAAWTSIREVRNAILQTASCVIVDPETAGAYKSGEALKTLWRSMEVRGGRLRKAAQKGMKAVAKVLIAAAESYSIGGEGGLILNDRVVFPEPDEANRFGEREEGEEIEAPDPRLEPHKLGPGGPLKVIWPPYHKPTPTQIAQLATAMTVASGKPVLSQETATEQMAGELGIEDPGGEYARLQEEKEANVEAFGLPLGAGGTDADREASEDDADRAIESSDDDEGKQPPAGGDDGGIEE